MNQRELEPQLGQPYNRLSHQICAFWGIGKDGYLLLLCDFKEWICCKRDGKGSLLMHAFMLCLLSFLFTLLFFSFLCYFSFSSLHFLVLVAILLPFMATVSIYIGLILYDFSLLPLWLTNHFCMLWTPLQSSPLSYWLFGRHYIWACRVHSLSSTAHSIIGPNLFGPAMSLFPLLERIRLWVSLFTHLSDMHQVFPPVYHPFWVKMPS